MTRDSTKSITETEEVVIHTSGSNIPGPRLRDVVLAMTGVFVDVRYGPKAFAQLRVLPHALNRRKDLNR